MTLIAELRDCLAEVRKPDPDDDCLEVYLLRKAADELDRLTGERDAALREEICPFCEGREMRPGSFCIVGCRQGVVRTTSANVLRNVKFWFDAAEARAQAAEQRCADIIEQCAKVADQVAELGRGEMEAAKREYTPGNFAAHKRDVAAGIATAIRALAQTGRG